MLPIIFNQKNSTITLVAINVFRVQLIEENGSKFYNNVYRLLPKG